MGRQEFSFDRYCDVTRNDAAEIAEVLGLSAGARSELYGMASGMNTEPEKGSGQAETDVVQIPDCEPFETLEPPKTTPTYECGEGYGAPANTQALPPGKTEESE